MPVSWAENGGCWRRGSGGCGWADFDPRGARESKAFSVAAEGSLAGYSSRHPAGGAHSATRGGGGVPADGSEGGTFEAGPWLAREARLSLFPRSARALSFGSSLALLFAVMLWTMPAPSAARLLHEMAPDHRLPQARVR